MVNVGASPVANFECNAGSLALGRGCVGGRDMSFGYGAIGERAHFWGDENEVDFGDAINIRASTRAADDHQCHW